jgi:hypothetical protein
MKNFLKTRLKSLSAMVANCEFSALRCSLIFNKLRCVARKFAIFGSSQRGFRKALKFFLILLALQNTSCRWFTKAGKPYFFGSNFKVPEGTPVFQQGYKDGCSTILFARGNGFYRSRNDYHYDVNLSGNPEYRFGHSRGQSWCFQNIIGPNPIASFDRYLMPFGNGNTTFDMTAGNINDTYGGMFDGLQAPGNPNAGGFDSIFGVWSGGETGGVFSANPLWAGGSKGQIFGQ